MRIVGYCCAMAEEAFDPTVGLTISGWRLRSGLRARESGDERPDIAAADDKLPLAKVLIAKGVSPNKMEGGSTALDVASSSRNFDLAKLLLSQGADISHAPRCANVALPLPNG